MVGMSRSGNHAIINWILAQARGRTCFLNCAEPRTNPFVTARPLTETEPAYKASWPQLDIESEREGRFAPKDYLVHSYEDTFLRPFADPSEEALHEARVGPSWRRLDLLILRDPFNLFASRVASSIGHVSIEIAARIWCQHAREFLGLRRHLKNERVMVSYNDWVTSRDYRHALALRLGFEFEDSAANAVARTGGGSSFDGTVHDGHALDMRVLERWRGYVGDPYYARAFTPEVLQLADRIFGIAAWEPQFQAAAAG